MLDLNTNIKKNEVRGKEKLTGRQYVAKFKVGYGILKAKKQIKHQWLDGSKGSMKRKLRKTGKQYSNKIVGVVCLVCEPEIFPYLEEWYWGGERPSRHLVDA